MAAAAEPAPRNLPRWSLALLSALHALVLGWAALMLPWRDFTVFSAATALLALLHAITAALSALRHRGLATVWRVTAVLAIAYLGYLAWGLLSSAWTIGTTYSGLGSGVAAALGAIVGLVMLLTLPFACWGLAATGGLYLGKKGGGALLALLLLTGGRLWLIADRARGFEIAGDAVAAEMASRAASIDPGARRAADKRRPSLMTDAPSVCSEPIDGARLSLIATFVGQGEGRDPAAVSRCLQAHGIDALVDELAAMLAGQALRGPIKLDVVARRAPIVADGLIAALSIRPGLDGVCRDDGGGARCLMPWQLVALDVFSHHQLLESVPDARLGASIGELRQRLEATPSTPLYRIATHSWLLDAKGELRPIARDPQPSAALDEPTLTRATRMAELYIARAQMRDGRFTYLLDPFTGRVEHEPFSVARQAGTTLALCELGDGSRATTAAKRSLDFLATLEQRFGQEEALGVLRYPPDSRDRVERIGASALALATFARCRPLTGDRHDSLIGRLARLLLAQQRVDGSFHHRVDVAQGRPWEAGGSLYVDGQAVLALVLVEGFAAAEEGALPARVELHQAAERAMSYFGERYWDLFVENFFYLEENWHCIAAAAALEHHRHDAYERFCLDYVRFKSRIVHGEEDGVHADFLGGYGIGNVVPPHNTATAGFGEALAAALLVKQARGLDTSRDEALLRRVMSFLLRNQSMPQSCFACVPTALGGFSEHMASPRIRIDYVQHAWAALGHGARALGSYDSGG